MPMRLVYEALVKVDHLKDRQGKEKEEMDQEKCYCRYHGEMADHSIQECPQFFKMIQEMINRGEIEFCGKMKEQDVNILLKEVPKPLTVFYRGGGQQATTDTPHVPTPKLVVKVPAHSAMLVTRRCHGIT